MSPPMMDEPTTNPSTVPASAAKTTIMPHTTNVPVNGHTKPQTIEDMAGAWKDFQFAPIRESQVSRAMTRRYFADLD
ncbi:thiamine metabolism-related protein, partial [Friedmanniomyces endolithicus]